MITMDSSSVSCDRNTFYGRHLAKTLPVGVRIYRQVKRNRIKRTPTPYRSRITGPCSSWEVYYRQKDAFKFIHDSGQKDLRVWSYESELFVERSGQRMYLAASLPKFWHYYSQLPTNQRHHYEVIPEDEACKLYFDLEYSTACNPGRDGPRMVDIFIKYVCYQLEKVYGIVCSKQDIIQLDASIPTKFSQHLIFCRQDTAFKDNEKAGRFTGYCCSELENILASPTEEGPSESPGVSSDHQVAPLRDEILELASLGLSMDDLESLFVLDKEGRKVIFCDKGVYTKNRNFRLYLSCKLGKQNPLVMAEGNTCICDSRQSEENQRKIFMESIITNLSDLDPNKLLSWENHGQKDSSNGTSRRHEFNREKPASAEGTSSKSPYPEVDEFVTSVVSRGGCHGNIRRWANFSDAEVLTYDIAGNRYCHNIGRAHKSNNIMILADLQHGVYYQKCHDPDCRAANYKSEEWPLPSHVLPGCILGNDDDNFLSPDVGTSGYQWDDDDDDLCFHDDAWMQNVAHSSFQDSGVSGVEEQDDEFLVKAAEEMETSLVNGVSVDTSKDSLLSSELCSDDDDALVTAMDSFEKDGT